MDKKKCMLNFASECMVIRDGLEDLKKKSALHNQTNFFNIFFEWIEKTLFSSGVIDQRKDSLQFTIVTHGLQRILSKIYDRFQAVEISIPGQCPRDTHFFGVISCLYIGYFVGLGVFLRIPGEWTLLKTALIENGRWRFPKFWLIIRLDAKRSVVTSIHSNS